MADIWTALQARKRVGPGTPLVTFVDASRGERVELSVTSIENAAAKIANALRSEYDLDQGARVAVHLPVHWQRAAWCAGIWTAGCELIIGAAADGPEAADADLHVAGPVEAVALAERGLEGIAVVSLHPFGLPVSDGLPPGAQDATLVVRTQPDAYLYEPPHGGLPALVADGLGHLTGAEVLDLASQRAADWGLAQGGRLLADHRLPDPDAWLAALAVPMAANASVILVSGAADLESVGQAERATAIAGQPR